MICESWQKSLDVSRWGGVGRWVGRGGPSDVAPTWGSGKVSAAVPIDLEVKRVRGVNSWFCTLLNAYNDFVSDERIVWVDIEGIPLHVWSRETFAKIGNKWGEALDIEDNFGSSFALFSDNVDECNVDGHGPLGHDEKRSGNEDGRRTIIMGDFYDVRTMDERLWMSVGRVYGLLGSHPSAPMTMFCLIFGPIVSVSCNHWLRMEGFDSMVEHAWLSFSHSDSNAMVRFKKKLQVITKVLANRLATVISDLVSETQSAFVANRQILDGPFILNEMLNWCKRKKKQAMFFKVDFAKAYDSVRWDYLLDILHAFGFGPNWCRWIRGTFTSSMASILVNGKPIVTSSPFCCGLKQGDPLAPYLFILIMESLHISFSRVVDDGLFKGTYINSVKLLIASILRSGLIRSTLLRVQVLGVGVSQNVVVLAAIGSGVLFLKHSFSLSWCDGWECMYRRQIDPFNPFWASPMYYCQSFKVPKRRVEGLWIIRFVFFRCDVARVVLRKFVVWVLALAGDLFFLGLRRAWFLSFDFFPFKSI
ncbi:RNA-directed DNA polymerase, eukaryota [Tanacetum coccineum]